MLAVVDIRMPRDCLADLTKRGFEVLLLPPFSVLPVPVASHPDMLMFITDRHLITHKDYYSQATAPLDRIANAAKLELLLTDEPIGNVYPQDVLFNAATVGHRVIGRHSSISKHIANYCRSSDRELIDVHQGYTKCSTCIISDNAIITADRGIAAAASYCGIDALEITPGHVRLDGYDCGFIGGASGLCGDKVYFCGNIDSHPDADTIRVFCQKHGKAVVSLGNAPLLDVGTIFFI